MGKTMNLQLPSLAAKERTRSQMIQEVSTGGPLSTTRPRAERRIAVRLPITVRGRDVAGVTFEEVTSSENLCRGGAAFKTKFDVAVGMDLDISSRSRKPARAAELKETTSPPMAASSTSATPKPANALSASNSPTTASAASSSPNPPSKSRSSLFVPAGASRRLSFACAFACPRFRRQAQRRKQWKKLA